VLRSQCCACFTLLVVGLVDIMFRDARIQYVVSTAAVIVLVTGVMLVMTVLMRVPAVPYGGSP